MATARPDRPSMKPVIIIIAVLAVLIGGSVIAWRLFQRSVHPFDGETEHDFGFVRLQEPNGVVEHVFVLRNRSSETLHIDHLHGSCGCINAEADTETVEPDQTVRITATLRVTAYGVKEETIGVHTTEFGVQTLTMTAKGQRDPPIFAGLESIVINDRGLAIVGLHFLVYENADRPDEVTVAAPPWMTASAGEWKLGRKGSPGKNSPTRWKAAITLKWPTDDEDEAPESLGELRATCGEYEVVIPLVTADEPDAPADTEEGAAAESASSEAGS